MVVDSVWRTISSDARARALERRWQKLCAVYLPVAPPDSIWNYQQASDEDLPECGWKLHVSATILNAPGILQRIAPLLIRSGVQFKAARSLADVLRLNSGLLHTYSQVGKIITVYPRNDNEAVALAQDLHKLTCRFRSPSIPFDLRLRPGSNVYYRYGAFKRIEAERPDGGRILLMPSPSGEMVPDVRESPKPDWVNDPFAANHPPSEYANPKAKPKRRPTKRFHVLRALVQRGKGGVYQAIDLQATPPRLCLLKEGRRHGEVTWDGRDGAWRVRNEARVLSHLSRRGLQVPEIYSKFELNGNFYLVMEFVDGESLHSMLLKQQKRLSLDRVLSLAIQLASFLEQMHRVGWAWRDCKPKNLLVNNKGSLVPIDFEGAEPVNRPDPLLWGTPGFVPLPSGRKDFENGLTDDLYALGVVLYLLITGRIFDAAQPTAIAKLRRRVPLELRQLVESLLSDSPPMRPAAHVAKTRLISILLRRSRNPSRAQTVKAA